MFNETRLDEDGKFDGSAQAAGRGTKRKTNSAPLAASCESVVREFLPSDLTFMNRAMELARRAEDDGEVPVGAVVVLQGRIIGEGWNRPIAACDPTAHAEMEALRQAAHSTANYRLAGATLYCTLEPCAMCAGAMVTARLRRLVFATRDLRFGAIRSKFALADSPLLNHQVVVDEGLLAPEASELIAEFFRKARQKNL